MLYLARFRLPVLKATITLLVILGLLAWGHFLFHVAFVKNTKPILNLDGTWQHCFSPDRTHCDWKPISVPDPFPVRVGKDFDGWLRYETQFQTPRECLNNVVTCQLIVGQIGDSAEAFLNGQSLGRRGSFSPLITFSKFYTARYDIESHLFKPDPEVNTLTFLTYTMKGSHPGIRRGPVAIYESNIADKIIKSRLFEYITLPLVCSTGLFVFALIGLFQTLSWNAFDEKLMFYVNYCLIAALFLVSFTDVPREYLPLGLASILSFTLRMCHDWSFFELAFGFTNFSQKVRTLGRSLFAITLLSFVGLSHFGNLSFDQSYDLMRWTTPTEVLPALLGAIGIYRLPSSTTKKLLIGLFAIVLPLQISDILVFNGYYFWFNFIRFYPLLIGIIFGCCFIISYTEKSRRLYSDAQLGKLASQVAHDIRSPLAALDMAVANLGTLPEEHRLLVRSASNRIQDIANDLSRKKNRTLTEDNTASDQLLSGLVEELVTEKRLQYRSLAGVTIETHFDKSSYGLFALLPTATFKRVLSNLINNAVEALPKQGLVRVSLAGTNDAITLTIQDNGKGIPPEILPRLMQRGETHGKSSGSGLGLFHARTSLQSWGGDLHIASQAGSGTCVTLTLPRQPAPPWFVPQIRVKQGRTIAVLDDDNSIHEVWKRRFEALVREGIITLEHFSSPDSFLEWHKRIPANNKQNTLALCDYEFLRCDKNGLDVIQELGIANTAILVTSRFEETPIREKCAALGVHMIPKNLAGFVPIAVVDEMRSDDEKTHQNNQIELILIDDDELVRLNWELSAKLKQKSILTFSDPSSFLAKVNDFNFGTKIYIDSNLADGIKGEAIAKQLFTMGFQNIYLATGYDNDHFSQNELTFLKGIIGKSPPWV